MSIPPLVCSTPPPLEQCEDDKDTEEFDLQYNLSHYDDDEGNDYNYGSFSTFSDMQSMAPKERELHVEFTNQVEEVIKISENVESKAIINDIESVSDQDKQEFTEEVVITEEEVNIEDLNLKLDQEEPPDIKADAEESTEIKCDDVSHVDSVIACVANSSHEVDVSNCTVDKPVTEDSEEYSSKNVNDEMRTTIQENFLNEIEKDHIDHNKLQHIEYSVKITNEHKSEDIDTLANEIKNEQDSDDDFDEFKFISSDNEPVNKTVEVFDSQESPWGNEESTNSDFGNFTANFEDSASQFQPEKCTDDLGNNIDNPIAAIDGDDDDDFGDFDDFKSSAAEVKSNDNFQGLTQQVSVLNLPPENENQVIESVNKVLTSIFKEETLESEEILEAKLDSVLNETWGHLMETDVRQPYIVNWNNSLAQKTLLKALCIDSRNILFGPKWSYNMPKYAANLTSAPLQPQKQSSSSAMQCETANPDKGATKPASWSDPFATNGQEFTYAEALLLDLEHLMATLDQMAHNHSTLKISELLSHACSNEGDSAVIEPRPTDLDVFEAAVSTKKDKIYSSTISVQPIRQINLPDTHIFTPTDSETPRSKTIHYDCGPAPTVLVPQPATDNFKIDEKKPVSPSAISAPSNTDNEYWEFQDFKGKEENNSSLGKDMGNNTVPKSNVTYQTQLLQPIKLEPIIPTLNWPDPGEIKETFEDFSDFVANSTSSVKEVVSEELGKSINEVPLEVQAKSTEVDIKEGTSKTSDSFDDEFDTFQSALPAKQNANFEFNFSSIENKLESNKISDQSSPLHENHSEFDCAFPNNTNIKSDDISFTNFTKPLEAMSQPSDIIPQKVPSSAGANQTNSILQPTLTGSLGTAPTNSFVPIQIQQKSGQILQPLSLEGYSQINWPNPGIDLQDLSRFNPVETLPSLKSDTSGNSKVGTPIHHQKTVVSSQASDDDIWGEFVSSNPKQTLPMPKKVPAAVDDDEWTDFVSSSSVKPQNGLNTISFNVHTNSNMQKSSNPNKFKNNQIPLDIPSLNYITPKTGNHKSYNDKHFQNL